MVIHPIFPIEENASILRTWVWFSPPHPPTRTEAIPTMSTNSFITISFTENRIIRGAIFCHVAIIKPLEKGSPCRTSGSQKWQGTSPSLNARAVVMETEDTTPIGSSVDQDPFTQACISAPFSSKAALIAWTKKYFMVASTLRGENLEDNSGIRAKVLTSRPIQIINHFSEDTTIIVPKTIVEKSKVDITRCIELGGTLTLNNLIIS